MTNEVRPCTSCHAPAAVQVRAVRHVVEMSVNGLPERIFVILFAALLTQLFVPNSRWGILGLLGAVVALLIRGVYRARSQALLHPLVGPPGGGGRSAAMGQL
jgi:hypothetical protein